MMENRLLVPTCGSSGVEVGRTSRRLASSGPHHNPALGTASDRSGASSFETMLHSAEKRFHDGGSDRRDESVQSSGHPDRNRSADVENGRKEATSTPDGERENLVNTGEAGVETGPEDSIEIGRASCRERVEEPVGGGASKGKRQHRRREREGQRQ